MMKALSFAAVLLLASPAFAGDPKAAPAPAAGKPAAAAQPAPAKPATPATPAKPATPAAPVKPAEPAKEMKAAPMEMPKAPAEIVAAGKAMNGAWKCTGTMFMPDGSSRPTTGTMKFKLDLDNFWVMGTFAETKGTMKYKFTSYRTFDAASKKWSSVMVDNVGGMNTATSMDGHSWEGSGAMAGMTWKTKDTETMVSAKEAKMTGQGSMDGGKTWMPSYDVVCKK